MPRFDALPIDAKPCGLGKGCVPIPIAFIISKVMAVSIGKLIISNKSYVCGQKKATAKVALCGNRRLETACSRPVDDSSDDVDELCFSSWDYFWLP